MQFATHIKEICRRSMSSYAYKQKEEWAKLQPCIVPQSIFHQKWKKNPKLVWVKSHGKLTKRIIEWISVHSKKFWDVYCTECIVSLAFKDASDLKIQWYRDFIRYDNLDTVFLVRISLNACRVFCTFCAQLSMYYLLL